MSAEDVKQERESEREHQVHQQLMGRAQDSNAPETLKYVSDPEDIDSPADALEWINSKATTTTNLGEKDVRSKEWVMEYFQLLSRMNKPPHYGVHGWRRAWARGDIEAREAPLEPDDAMAFEGYAELGKLASKKSEDGWGVETATRDTVETYQHKEEGGGRSGWFDRFRR